MVSIAPFLWFDGRAEEAYLFYSAVFAPADAPSPSLDNFVGSVALPGLTLHLFNGGPYFTFNEAISLMLSVDTQEEVDRYWNALSDGGEPGRCGWLKDRFGVSWQIVPTALGQLLGASDREAAGRAHAALMEMGKIDVQRLEAAFHATDPS